MRQTYYGVSDVAFIELQETLQQYTLLAKQLVSPELDKKEKSVALLRRNELKAGIQKNLDQSGILIGFLNDKQALSLETAIQKIGNREVQSLLRTNGIPECKLEEVLSALLGIQSDDICTDVIFFLERAKQLRRNVIVWIM